MSEQNNEPTVDQSTTEQSTPLHVELKQVTLLIATKDASALINVAAQIAQEGLDQGRFQLLAQQAAASIVIGFLLFKELNLPEELQASMVDNLAKKYEEATATKLKN